MSANKIFIEGILSEHKTKSKEELLNFLVEKEIISQKNVEYWTALYLFPELLLKHKGNAAIKIIAAKINKSVATVNYIVYNLRNKFR